mmetsp:Transcript_2054/g.7996  ORF Transcript_2054/g.7996 Transcript_2054/m.7996 type:complete len:227 (-) Transcript_2054:1381-2061(-)
MVAIIQHFSVPTQALVSEQYEVHFCYNADIGLNGKYTSKTNVACVTSVVRTPKVICDVRDLDPMHLKSHRAQRFYEVFYLLGIVHSQRTRQNACHGTSFERMRIWLIRTLRCAEEHSTIACVFRLFSHHLIEILHNTKPKMLPSRLAKALQFMAIRFCTSDEPPRIDCSPKRLEHLSYCYVRCCVYQAGLLLRIYCKPDELRNVFKCPLIHKCTQSAEHVALPTVC